MDEEEERRMRNTFGGYDWGDPTVYRCPECEGLHLTRNLWGPWNRALLAEYGIEREAA